MMKRIISRNKTADVTLIVRCKSEYEEEAIRKGFRKMIKEINHLLESTIGYEVIITSCCDRNIHREEKQSQ